MYSLNVSKIFLIKEANQIKKVKMKEELIEPNHNNNKIRCNGYQPIFKTSMLVDVPWQKVFELKNKTWKIDTSRTAFRSNDCFANEFFLNHQRIMNTYIMNV